MGIATHFSKPAATIKVFFGGEEPPKDLIHLIVTAGRQERQQEHRIKLDTLPDLVSKMHESEVLTMISRYALLTVDVLLRLSRHY